MVPTVGQACGASSTPAGHCKVALGDQLAALYPLWPVHARDVLETARLCYAPCPRVQHAQHACITSARCVSTAQAARLLAAPRFVSVAKHCRAAAEPQSSLTTLLSCSTLVAAHMQTVPTLKKAYVRFRGMAFRLSVRTSERCCISHCASLIALFSFPPLSTVL